MYDFPSTKEFLIQTERHKCNLNIVQSSKLKTKEKKKNTLVFNFLKIPTDAMTTDR